MQPLHTLCRRIGNFMLLFGAMPDQTKDSIC